MKYDLVFEGGGAKGMVLVGAYAEFEARNHEYARLLGTSAGAIGATLLAAGYSAAELEQAMAEKQNGKSVFSTFMSTPSDFDDQVREQSVVLRFLKEVDIPLIPEAWESAVDHRLLNSLMAIPLFRNLFSFVEQGGWFAADNFVNWIADKLDAPTADGSARGYSRMTLKQFFEATEAELSLVASDISDQRMLVFNHRTAPDLPVVWAVRMSMSIPLLWQEVVWQPQWGSYRGRDLSEHVIVDGGLLSNFPIELFISDLDHVTAIMGPKQGNGVLGFLIDESLEVADAPDSDASEKLFDFGNTRVLNRLYGFLNTAMQAHDKMVIDGFRQLVMHLPAKGFGTAEFEMTDPRREALIAAGRGAARHYFDLRPAMTPDFSPAAAANRERAQQRADTLADRLLDD